MKLEIPKLFTPFYAKLSDDMPWPEHEKAFYLLTRDGCFLCRNHPFFRSSVAAEKLPSELARHDAFLRLSYPRLAQRQFERVIGFFHLIGERHGAEAAALLVWNTKTRAVEVIVPPQTSIVSSSWSGRPYPIEVHYEVQPLPPHLMLVGDIHSHVDGAAYASFTDRDDEAHRPGLHIVVGRISEEPPEFYVAAVVDGARFRVKSLFTVVQGYSRRRIREVPQAWIEQVKVTTWSNYKQSRCQTETASTTDSERQRLDNWLETRNVGPAVTPDQNSDGDQPQGNDNRSHHSPDSNDHV